MKKTVLFILSICTISLLVGCGLRDTPTKKTEEFLNNYKNLDDDVLGDLDLSAEAENLNETNKSTYKTIMKRQYQDMKYEILSEDIDKDEATVTAKITVYDLYKMTTDANAYLLLHEEEFMTNNQLDQDKFDEYKLKNMKNTETTVNYTVVFNLTKVENEWVVQQPDQTIKEKLHGLYNYED